MDHLWSATIYGRFAGLATLISIYLVLMKEAWVRRGSIYLVGFASGALLSAALLDILPESLELNRSASLYVLLSFLAFYILEQNLVLHAGHEDLECCGDEERHRLHSLGVISFLGIGFHSLLDGVLIRAGFSRKRRLIYPPITGSFLYIAASDLIPQTREERSPYIIPLVVVGMLTLFALGLVFK